MLSYSQTPLILPLLYPLDNKELQSYLKFQPLQLSPTAISSKTELGCCTGTPYYFKVRGSRFQGICRCQKMLLRISGTNNAVSKSLNYLFGINAAGIVAPPLQLQPIEPSVPVVGVRINVLPSTVFASIFATVAVIAPAPETVIPPTLVS